MADRKVPGKDGLSSAPPKLLDKLTDAEIIERTQEGTLAWRPNLVKTPAMARRMQAMSPGELELYVQKLLGFRAADRDMTERVLLDLYVAAVDFAVQHAFSPQQLSAFITLLHTLMANLKEQSMKLPDNIAFCAQLLQLHAPASLQTTTDTKGHNYDFPPACLPLVIQFIYESIFQHYALYTQLFSPSRSPVSQTIYAPIIEAGSYQPLPEAVSEDEPAAEEEGTSTKPAESAKATTLNLTPDQVDALKKWALQEFAHEAAERQGVDRITILRHLRGSK